MSNFPLVSIIIPSYKHEKYIVECLHSVVEQTYENIELIVIDDCSPDKTAEVARKELAKPEYQQKLHNIVLHEKKINQGAHNAINDGIKEAKGDWINILNSDDRFICNRIKSLILTAQSTGSRFLFSKIRCIGGNGENIKTSFASNLETIAGKSKVNLPSMSFGFLGAQIAITTGNFFIHKSLIEEVGEFKDLKYCHDWDYAMRMIAREEPVYLDEILYEYRLHNSNSFLDLNNIAEKETAYVQSNFREMFFSLDKINPLAPYPWNWQGIFDTFARHFGVQNHW